MTETAVATLTKAVNLARARLKICDTYYPHVLTMLEAQVLHYQQLGAVQVAAGLDGVVELWKRVPGHLTQLHVKLNDLESKANAIQDTMTATELADRFSAISRAILDARDAAYHVDGAATDTHNRLMQVMGHPMPEISEPIINGVSDAANDVGMSLHTLHPTALREEARATETARQSGT